MDTQKDVKKEWLRAEEVKYELGISHGKFWQLVAEGAFPVSKPSGRLAYVKRTDLTAFLTNGYPKQSPQQAIL